MTNIMNLREIGVRRAIEIRIEKRRISETECSRFEAVMSLYNSVDGTCWTI